MHRLVRNLALSLVLFHVMAGCCWHHLHGACVDCRQASAPEVAGSASHEHDGPGHHSHDHRAGCDRGKCEFVVPESASLLKPVGPSPLVAAVLAESVPRPLGAAKAFVPLSWQAACDPPLRLHLLNQVLLV